MTHEKTTSHDAEVRTVYNENGDRCVGWVIPSVNWRGQPRWQGQVEREFVRFSIEWQSWRRYKTRERAIEEVNKVLDRIERKGWERV